MDTIEPLEGYILIYEEEGRIPEVSEIIYVRKDSDPIGFRTVTQEEYDAVLENFNWEKYIGTRLSQGQQVYYNGTLYDVMEDHYVNGDETPETSETLYNRL